MQRYHGASCTSAVNNSGLGGIASRDTTRADTSSLPTNFSISSRRSVQLLPYRLKCEKESLNSRLGPPDFHPQTPNCPEETLTRDYVQSGYRETIEGVEDARELSLSHVNIFTKPVVLQCKEAIRKRLRAINESRAQKRKAGQVYGVPLSASLLSKPGLFPEQRPFSEDSRKRWVEGLSQYQKSLQALADNVPHGYRKKSLFEVLIRNSVPLLRATWFIKVTYLNQIRPGSSRISSEKADKAQLSRTEHWTKDVIEYLQYLLDEYLCRKNSHSLPQNKDQNRQMLYACSAPHKSDSASCLLDAEEPSLHFKWWYMVRLVHCHCSEGLILPSQLIDWIIQQLQEKDVVQVLQLILPIIYGMLETIILSQTCVRSIVDVALRFLKEPSSVGSPLVDNSRRAYTKSSLAEMLRYLIMSVPDTFVAFEMFPPSSSAVTYMVNGGYSLSKLYVDADGTKSRVNLTRKLNVKYQSLCFSHMVASIEKRAAWLAKAASPGCCGQHGAKAVQALNTALFKGDVKEAYKFLFEDVSDTVVDECWISDVSPSLRSWLKWIDSISLSFICSVFLLCEWCTCDYGDLRNGSIHDLKFTGGKDFSQILVAVRLLKLQMRDLHRQMRTEDGNLPALQRLRKGLGEHGKNSQRSFYHSHSENKSNLKLAGSSSVKSSDLFESPNAFHDIIVCWIDQHEVQKGEGLKRVQLLLVELICSGVFYPPAYTRQLIVSGVMDRCGSMVNVDRRRRHFQVLKHLPPAFVHDAMQEAKFLAEPELVEAMRVYGNERRLLLRGLLSNGVKNENSKNTLHQKVKYSVLQNNASSVSPIDQPKVLSSSKFLSGSADIEELKAAISVILQIPKTSASADSVDELRLNLKRPFGLISNNMDSIEGTLGCEECLRVKKQKVSNDKGSSPNLSDDDDTWWVRQELKSAEVFKVELPLKPAKQASRGRQKTVRKTQSLAHLATARIEGSQGASTSHVCDTRIVCPHHRTSVDGDAPKSVDGVKASYCGDIVSIGKMLKQKRHIERRSIGNWLMTTVKQLVEESDRTAKGGQLNKSLSSVDERISIRWTLGEDELSVILYLMDASSDLLAAVRFLIWLLPKAVGTTTTNPAGRNTMLLAKNMESYGCEVGEPFLLSCMRRYENILVAADLMPEFLSAAMLRATTVITSNGRLFNSPIFFYARYLMKKYEGVSSVVEWETNFRATCDRRLISEIESGRLQNLSVPSGGEDLDDVIRQKISGNRLSRAGMSMRDTVQRFVDDMVHHLFGKERKLFAAGAQRSVGMEKWDDGYQIAQQIVLGLMDCIRKTGGAAQEGDPSLVSSAVSAIVSNVGPVVAKMPDFTVVSNHTSLPSPTGSLNFARRIIRVHINCLCLLKEALGERNSRAFEIALAAEASSALAGVLAPGKAARGQFQFSPDAQESNGSVSSDISNNSVKVVVGRATKTAAAVSALVVGAVIHGVASLERMVRVFRLKEGLDVMKFVRSSRTNSNGSASARTVAALKVDNSLEVHIHWFRLLVGNCRTVSDGLIVELLGEPSIVALSRMQRTLPLDVVFPPAYSIFAFMIWRPVIFSTSLANREDNQQLFNSMVSAIGDAIKHMPFRDVCMRDTRGFYGLVTLDPTDYELAAFIEMNGSERHLKGIFVPLRSRLFLNALVDCKLPFSVLLQDDGNRAASRTDSKMQYPERETKIFEKLVHALDTLQLAKFHWQWVELKLLLNEQELDSNHAKSIAEAMHSLSPTCEKTSTSEHENHFVECVLTRLLVRPDAAPLLSEIVHLFGKLIENSMLVSVKWFLAGEDVLYGRKSIRQRLVNVAERKNFSTKALFWKPWGWRSSDHDANRSGCKRKLEIASLEEGEVGADFKRRANGVTHSFNVDSINPRQQLFAEKGLIDLFIPCLDRSSDESCNMFAGDLIKQMNNIEQQISGVNGGATKQTGTSPSGTEGSASKASNRKSMKGGSPGLSRRLAGPVDSLPSPPAALRASIALRLELLLRLLPTICADGETNRSMRSALATVILRLLGSRIVYEDVELSNPGYSLLSKRDVETEKNGSTSPLDLSGRNIFDWLLLVLHALLSQSQPSWLKVKSASKLMNESAKVSFGIDRQALENIQNELDRMQLSDIIRRRIKAAMPTILLGSRSYGLCHPPSIPTCAVTILQSSISVSTSCTSQANMRNSSALTRAASSMAGKSKSSLPQPDVDMEIDPWTLLEDGAGAGPSTYVMGSSDHSNVRAASWLKGAVRVRRTHLTYIASMDDDS